MAERQLHGRFACKRQLVALCLYIDRVCRVRFGHVAETVAHGKAERMGAELVRGQLTVVAVAQRGDFILSLIHIHLTDKRLQRAADPFAAERKQRRCFGRRHRYRLALRGYGKGRRCKHLQAVLRRGGVNEKMLLLRLCQRHRRHYLTRLVRSRIGFRSGVGLCRNKACRIRADAVCIRGNAAFFIVRMAARLCFVKRVVAAPPEAHGRLL